MARFAGALVALVMLVASSLDRLGWARLSQWREDQATNLWLGFTRGPLELPVGLVSSVGVANPNGMPLLGIPLSRLPGLLAVSWTLGTIQAALVVALCFSLSLGLVERAALAGVLLSSVLLRASSVEFWNQWLLTSLNLAFAVSVVRYLRRPTLAWLPAWTLLALIAPSLYLAGVVNGLVFAGIAALLLYFHRPASSRTTGAVALVASALVAFASAWSTWIPYAREVGVTAAASASPSSLPTRLLGAAISAVQSPLWWPFSWDDPASFVILQSSPQVLSSLASDALGWTGILLGIAHLVLLAALATALVQGRAARDQGVRPEPGRGWREVAWIAAIPAAAYVLSPLVGGPVWTRGQRPDMALQWLPLLVIAWFGATWVLPLSPGPRRVTRTLTLLLALLLGVSNLVLGQAVQDSYRAYRGPVLVPADVPLADKVSVVDRIAADWRAAGGGPSVPVDYDLGGGVWDWVPSFGRTLERWYPAPMTLGRAFDYELLRRHGLANAQEGRPRDPPGAGRYVVSYLAFPPPPLPASSVRHVPVGRLRLSIVDR